MDYLSAIRGILTEYALWEKRFERGYRGTMSRERFEAHLDWVAEKCGIDENDVDAEATRLADEITQRDEHLKF